LKTLRNITTTEKAKARRSHLLVIPLAIVLSLVAATILNFDRLPTPARWIGMAICAGIIMVFISKSIRLERELKNGRVQEVTGMVLQKIKFGGSSSSNVSGAKGGRRTKSSATYILKIDEEKYWVNFGVYKKVDEGQRIRMIHLPKSQVVLDIEVTS